MNLHKAWEARDQLNEKMSRLLLQGLQTERINYLRAIKNYSPEQMAQYGEPSLKLIESKIETVHRIIDEKFNR